MNIYRFY